MSRAKPESPAPAAITGTRAERRLPNITFCPLRYKEVQTESMQKLGYVLNKARNAMQSDERSVQIWQSPIRGKVIIVYDEERGA